MVGKGSPTELQPWSFPGLTNRAVSTEGKKEKTPIIVAPHSLFSQVPFGEPRITRVSPPSLTGLSVSLVENLPPQLRWGDTVSATLTPIRKRSSPGWWGGWGEPLQKVGCLFHRRLLYCVFEENGFGVGEPRFSILVLTFLASCVVLG